MCIFFSRSKITRSKLNNVGRPDQHHASAHDAIAFVLLLSVCYRAGHSLWLARLAVSEQRFKEYL